MVTNLFIAELVLKTIIIIIDIAMAYVFFSIVLEYVKKSSMNRASYIPSDDSKLKKTFMKLPVDKK
jgi:hypothetical protein